MFNREEAARRAEAARTNSPGTCQLWTRTMYGVESAGDRDRDGDADAVDGWLSEPKAHRHTDRNPPRGVPVAFSGGSRGFGHRAISRGDGIMRSTDMHEGRYKAGIVGNATIAEIERAMGVTYLGWSNTITGQLIPMPPPPKPPSRGNGVDEALRKLTRSERRAKEGTRRDTLLDRAVRALKKIKPTR